MVHNNLDIVSGLKIQPRFDPNDIENNIFWLNLFNWDKRTIYVTNDGDVRFETVGYEANYGETIEDGYENAYRDNELFDMFIPGGGFNENVYKGYKVLTYIYNREKIFYIALKVTESELIPHRKIIHPSLREIRRFLDDMGDLYDETNYGNWLAPGFKR